MDTQNLEIYTIHADFCKTISNPKRLMIIDTIGDQEKTVGELAKSLNLSVSNISQHLKTLKNYDIVKSNKIGHNVYYSLNDLRLLDICRNMRSIISDLYMKRKNVFNEKS